MERLPHRPGAGPAGAPAPLVAVIDATGPPDDDPSPGPDGVPPPGPVLDGAAADELLERTAAAGGTVIWLAEGVSGEPSELSLRIRLDDHG